MNTFMMPPQTAGLSDEISSSRSTRTVRGLRARMTSMASLLTSASPQPPPIVPRISPQAVTTILAPTSRGVEPFVDTMVDGERLALVEKFFHLVVDGLFLSAFGIGFAITSAWSSHGFTSELICELPKNSGRGWKIAILHSPSSIFDPSSYHFL